MRPLDDTFQITPTISTLSKTAEKTSLGQKEKETNDLSDWSDVESEMYSQASASIRSPELSSLTSTFTESTKKKRKKNNQSEELQTAIIDVLKIPVTNRCHR